MYSSGLMPRGLALLGLVAGPLVCLSGIAVILGVIDKQFAPQAIMTIPEILWDLSLCIYPVLKGFKPSPALARFEAETAHARA
jgi:hypothetical protein